MCVSVSVNARECMRCKCNALNVSRSIHLNGHPKRWHATLGNIYTILTSPHAQHTHSHIYTDSSFLAGAVPKKKRRITRKKTEKRASRLERNRVSRRFDCCTVLSCGRSFLFFSHFNRWISQYILLISSRKKIFCKVFELVFRCSTAHIYRVQSIFFIPLCSIFIFIRQICVLCTVDCFEEI